MKLLISVLSLTFVFFLRSSSAQSPVTPAFEHTLDSLFYSGEYASGEEMIRSAISRNQSTSDTTLAWLSQKLGAFTQELGKYADAEDAYLRSEKIYSASLSADHPYVASVLSRLSVLYSEQGRFADALSSAREQFLIYTKFFGKDHPATALASIVLALQYLNTNQTDSSERLLAEYRPIIVKNFGAVSKEASRLHEAEGRMAFAKKDYRKAEASFIIARQTAQNTPGDKHPLTARIALALARTRLILGNTDSAMSNITDALGVAFRAARPSHPFTAECLMTKGCIEEASGNIPAAFGSYQQALAVYKEATRENFRYTSERERLAFIRIVNEQLSRVASTTLRTSAFYPGGIGIYYDGLLFQKGIVLSSLQSMRRRAVESGDSSVHALLDKLAAIRTRISRLSSGTAFTGKPFLDKDSLGMIANDLERDLARKVQAFEKLQALGMHSWKHIQGSQTRDNFCIEISRFPYYDGERRTDTTYYAALILQGSDTSAPHLAVIGTDAIEDSSVIRQYFRSLEKHPRKKNTNAALISKLLWSPLEPFVAGAKKIFIAPDGIYDQIAIPALFDNSGKRLLEQFQIATVATTADAAELEPQFDSASIDIFANPDFSAGELEPLPGTMREAESISQIFDGYKWKVHSFTLGDATEKNLKLRHHPSILHIATHGRFSSNSESVIASESLESSNPFTLENSLI
ncbi:MAG: tetratricopeptide repeat protein, partial [Bacteroidota bacterium]|nr:tetratricopeptide repeat protein [Bacteroidota bacterium]